jgi:DivIVA domain-containing protein
MDQDDPEKRIAELERQLAEARSAGDPGATGGSLTPEQVRNMAFSRPPRGKRGYNEDEVDAFLDLVEAALRDPARRTLTPEQVRNMAFSRPPIGKRGYNEEEVDALLDVVEQQLKFHHGGVAPPPQAGSCAADLAGGVVETPFNEESASSVPPRRWELLPYPSVWKRRPPLTIVVDKDAIWVVDAKTNAVVTSAPLAQVTATRAQFTESARETRPWTSGHAQPLVVLPLAGLKPLIIASTAMKGYDAGYRFSWRGRVQEARANYVLREAEWFALVETLGLTPYLD